MWYYWAWLGLCAAVLGINDLYLRAHYYDDSVLIEGMLLPVLLAILNILLLDHLFTAYDPQLQSIADLLTQWFEAGGYP